MTTKQGSSGSLKTRALRASAFDLLGYGSSQVLRLGSNLVLSRLLFPEAFGLAALVAIVNAGLQMLSDVGVPAAIVQNERGEEEDFLNTAWTIQIIRGVVLWVLASALAWPIAALYEEPELKLLIPVGSITAIFLGLQSTSITTLQRRLQLGRPAALELGAQLAAIAVMIPWGLVAPSVWTLVGGSLTYAFTLMVTSHMISVGYRNRLKWDASAARAIYDLGKWLMGSSALTFASREADRMLLGKLMGAAGLGIYSIAIMMSNAVSMVTARLTRSVCLPAYSEVRHEGSERLSSVYYKTRLGLDLLVQPAVGGLAVLGPAVVEFLYDPRYYDAGWMLRVLAVRVAINGMANPCQFCLIAVGESKSSFTMNLATTLWVITALPSAWALWGVKGVVWAVALSEVPALFILMPALARKKLLRVSREFIAPALFGVGLLLGLLVEAGLVALGLR